MGLFKKKRDPISEGKRELDAKIAALESEIKRLSQQQSLPAEPRNPSSPAPASPAPPPPNAPPPRQHAPPAPAAPSGSTQSGPRPRLRSTALPHGPTITPTSSPAEPVFEELDQQRLHEHPEHQPPPPDLAQNLGVRKNGFLAFWDRLCAPFRGPATSNPKLVNYLAAGSIQGLRPLRYEKRVARNRLFLLVGLLILLLWGIVAVFLKHK